MMLDAELLSELGFDLGDQAVGGESQGAWFATTAAGTRVLLKSFPTAAMAGRYGELLPALDQVRSRGVPVPEYVQVLSEDDWTLSAQQLLPGKPMDNPPAGVVQAMAECIAAKAGIAAPLPLPLPDLEPWGAFVVRTLTVGNAGWTMHEPLRSNGLRSARLLDRIEALGSAAKPNWFPDDGLVHLDLHTDNVLVGDDGSLTGIIDWEGGCAGDHLFDLVSYAFDLDGHDQPVWDIVEAAGIEARVLRSYVAFMSLKCTDWAIRRHPHDVPRQLDRAERIFERFDV